MDLRWMAMVGLTLGLAACSSGTGATPSPSPSTTTPNLTGVWQSTERQWMDENGQPATGSETMTIGKIDGNVFTVKRHIVVDPAADFGTGVGPQAEVTLKTIGVVNPDGSFTVVKKGDDGQLQGWLVDDNTMNAVYTESGEAPIVMRETLVRQQQ